MSPEVQTLAGEAPTTSAEGGSAAASTANAAAEALAVYAADFTSRAAARAAEPAALRTLREESFARFQRQGFPSSRQEEWRFTNVGPLSRTRFARAASAPVAPEQVTPWLYAQDGTGKPLPHLVVVDGEVRPELSDSSGLPAGVRFGSLAAAIAAGDPAIARLGSHAAREQAPLPAVDAHGVPLAPLAAAANDDEKKSELGNSFVALNTALFGDGALLVVPRGVVVETPLQVLFVSTAGKTARVSYPRLLVVAEERSSVVLVERYVTVGDEATEIFTCPVSEILADASAVVDHYRLAQDGPQVSQVGLQQLWCDRAAAVTSYSVVTGGALVRQDVRAVLDGEGVEAILNGLYLTRGRQHVDHHMYVEHRQPHCNSHELYKGILEGRSRAVFNGLIHVHHGAQKTDAKQTNRNLLLSKEALVNTNPQLRIFADDVKCTHGSTVGQLDEEAVFYLRSRGIGEEAAKSLLTYAFARDVVDRIKAPAVRHDLEELLLARLPKGDVVRQAL